jgi:hypothetical protein
MVRASPVLRGESAKLAGFLSSVDLTSAIRDQAFHLDRFCEKGCPDSNPQRQVTSLLLG